MTTSGAGEMTDDNAGVYHVVCHDCTAEFLVNDGAEAERRLSRHRMETEHSVDMAALGGVTIASE